MRSTIVRNFGLFWERDQITWGAPGPGNAGHLCGRRGSPNDSVVDFREQRGIYVLYEGADIPSQRVVYVGQAGSGQNDLFHRLRNHRDYHLWNRWQRFSWLGFLSVGVGSRLVHKSKAALGNIDLSTALDQIEAILIALMEPLKNRQGPQWKGAHEYFQVGKSPINAAAVELNSD
jgi:hypothetical protein